MSRYKILIGLFFLTLTLPAAAQVSVQFVPEIFGRSIEGLMNARIINLQPAKSVRLNITVSEAKAGKVVVIQTLPFTMLQGANTIPVSAMRSAKMSIAANAVGNYIRRNQNFPTGDYDYNFDVLAASSSEEILVGQSFSHQVTPPSPLDLIEPFKDDKICEKRPTLTWQPSLPMINGQLYSVLLVEMKDKQNAVEALNYNLPIVNQRGVLNNILIYPPISKELVEGKKYAWQVTAYKDQTVINRSEVWAFTVNCKDSVVNTLEVDNGYRDIEDLARGNYYVARGIMKFALINSYEAQPLKYSISCITDPSQRIRSLPRKKLTTGKNKIDIDLSHNFSFKDGYSYLLHATLPNGTTKSLRFIYRDLE